MVHGSAAQTTPRCNGSTAWKMQTPGSPGGIWLYSPLSSRWSIGQGRRWLWPISSGGGVGSAGWLPGLSCAVGVCGGGVCVAYFTVWILTFNCIFVHFTNYSNNKDPHGHECHPHYWPTSHQSGLYMAHDVKWVWYQCCVLYTGSKHVNTFCQPFSLPHGLFY